MMKRIAQAWTFASVLLLPNYIDLTSSAGDARMRSPAPLTKIALSHLTDMMLVAIAFAALMALLRFAPGWPRLRWGVMALLPVLLLIRNLDVFPFSVPWSAVLTASLVWVGLLAFLLVKFPRSANRLYQAGSSLFAGMIVFALVMTCQICRAALWRPGPQAFQAAALAAPAHRSRLVWILFDELAYRPVFEARDSSLALPNFDRVRRESTLYTDMTPIAYRTTRAVPSILLGHAVTDVEFTANNRYMVQTAEDPHWQPFDAHATLFGEAQQRGLSVSIVGWYIAYCPIFVGIATNCYWDNDDAQDRGPTLLSQSYAENVWFPLRLMAEQAMAPARAWADDADLNAEGHIASVRDLQQHALNTIATSQSDIIYLHLPAPHPPAFWNRRTEKFAMGGSYLDSLAYSDWLLGQILDLLESQPRWDTTMLVVQGDHSWRTGMWRPLPGWSAEDERISNGGAWDPRPLLMIHTPDQKSALTVKDPTSVMYIHDAVEREIRAIAH
jgi:hypothetical protein